MMLLRETRGTAHIYILLRLSLLASLGLALTISAALASERRASLVVDANTGRILQTQAADEPRHPASLAKMMTLYIVFEMLEQRRLTSDTRIHISEAAADTPPSRLGLPAGSEIAVIDAVKALITKSANDVAAAIAEHVSGSQDKFARLMTQKARTLGMHATVFTNPHGLPDADQVTTARDMATLALRLNDDFPRWYPLFSVRSFAYQGRNYRNHNTLLGSYEGTDGIKTGYTASSGFNLVTSVRRDGKHIIGVVFGGTTAAARNAYMRALLNRGLLSASTHRTRQPLLLAKAPTNRPQTQFAAPASKPADHGKSPPDQPDEIARLMASVPETAVEAPEPRLARQTPVQIARVRQVLVRPAPPRPLEVASASAATMLANDAGPTSVPFQRASMSTDGTQGRTFAPAGLQAQAERLARGESAIDLPTVVARTAAPVPEMRPAGASSSPVHAGFAIQIGAYSSEGEAQRQLLAAKNRAAPLLEGRQPATLTFDQSGRRLYRARFAGFDAQSAAAACAQLRRLSVDCLVAKPE